MTARGLASGLASQLASQLAGSGGGGFSPSQFSDLRQFALAGGEPYEASTIDGLPMLRSLEPYGTYRQPRQGRAWLFDGVNDFATRGARITSSGQTKLTVTAWVKLTGSTSRVICGEWNLPYIFAIDITTTNKLHFGINNAIDVATTPSLANGVWAHVAISIDFDADTLLVTFDGASVAYAFDVGNITTVSSLAAGSTSFQVGSVGFVGFFNGSMRGIRVYNTAKTAPEIAAIYAGQDDQTGLIAHYPCNEESGTVGYDISGNGNHLTLTNITQSTFHATDTAVTSNRNNRDGYRLSGSVYIPKRLSDNLAADGNALTATGKAPYPANVEVPCITGDGTAVYVDMGSPLIPATADFEISLWYYHTTNAFKGLISTGTFNSTGRFHVFPANTPTNSLNLSLPDITDVIATSCLSNNSWNYIQVTKQSNVYQVSCNGVTATSPAIATAITQVHNIRLLQVLNAFHNNGRITDLRITTAGVTKYFPLQGGPGSSNTNRDVHWVASDGTYGVVANAITNGTVSTIWANRCPNAEDWCVKYGGRIAANGSFVPGNITGNLAADGNEKTLSAGKYGNPYSRINFNPFTAAELNGLGLETAYAVTTARQSVSPTDTKFRRTKADGDDRFFATNPALTGTDKTKAEDYIS
jgi:hypothetical protein